MKISAMKRDVAAAESGVWINKAFGDADLKIAATSNRRYRDYVQQLMKPYQRTVKTMTDEFFKTNIQNPALARFILVDWRNLEDDNGPLAYSEAKALELLNDPEMFDFRELIISLSDESEVFRKEALQELAGK